MSLHPALLQLIQALAVAAAEEDYLAAQATPAAVPSEPRSNPVPLPATDRAA